ncbi:MAG: energy-coupling factor transporter ATPase [Ruminococcaceae bacterium]|nr:energy-coupling factor transporter ATPase [Oscillospiraceae bacterium]
MEMIRTEQLQYNYRADSLHPALNGVSVSIRKGEFVAVLGHNGSGKSTFAKHLNAILLPSGGAVYVQGMDTRDEKLLYNIRQRVGMVFQNPDNQIVASLVEEDVAFAPENLGVPQAEIRARVDAALEAVGMSKYRDRATYQLSGGQKQRVAIAGIIAMQPECVVLDEPTAMLDPHGRRSVMRAIHAMNRELGITVVLITHHMNEAVGADRVLVMTEGRCVLDGTPREVFAREDVLKAAGLTVPQALAFIHALRDAGIDIDTNVLTEDECASALYDVLKKHGY